MNKVTQLTKVEVEIFDANPSESGPCDWGHTVSWDMPTRYDDFRKGNWDRVGLQETIAEIAFNSGSYADDDRIWWQATIAEGGRVGGSFVLGEYK